MEKSKKLYIHYAEDGLPDSTAESMSELARNIGKTVSAVSKGIMRGSKHYFVFEEENENDERGCRND